MLQLLASMEAARARQRAADNWTACPLITFLTLEALLEVEAGITVGYVFRLNVHIANGNIANGTIIAILAVLTTNCFQLFCFQFRHCCNTVLVIDCGTAC